MLLQGNKISKSYNKIDVLNNVDISVSSGEIVSIVGRSGAGKSTLLYILSSLEDPDKGDVLVDGINLKSLSKNQLAHFRNQNIGFIFQFHNLLPEFDALENVCIPGYISEKNRKDVERQGRYLLDFLDLSERIHHRPDELSGGEQQRVAVARSLINNPSIIFADEPSGNLDSKNSKQLFDLIKKLNRELDKTFVLVTHNLEFASIAKRILKIEDGKIK
ncbi:MAG: lipoprotein-releasing system ATP-binding protein LolD [Cytophagia bacterium]|jgi:lipoprotein-releasing system ATP-binding protein|nr:lipoprotein-releasing system ATP-binding protein LolD [Cytophagia bacterium]|tara:strand:- start:66 stop:719 length:654 start_codon:yes stop_codon:yes gene_type:complete